MNPLHSGSVHGPRKIRKNYYKNIQFHWGKSKQLVLIPKKIPGYLDNNMAFLDLITQKSPLGYMYRA